MEAESFLNTLKMSTTPQADMQGVLLQELIFFMMQTNVTLPPDPPSLTSSLSAAQELLFCLECTRCRLGAINPTLSGPVGLTVPVDSVCAADPANSSQHCCAHGCTAHVHTQSNQAVPSYSYQASRNPQNLPFKTRQAFRQEKGHVRKMQAYGKHSHCRTFR